MNNSTFHKFTGPQVKALRKKTGLTQAQFWNRIGITQACGSQYENGSNMPAKTQMLFMIVYGSTTRSANLVAKLRDLSKEKL